ncbi:hypothetical protein C0991_006898 [Blastosporella zonata]|nr:hypothetical protein C0991_006898 [Blastosporella zonata]
MAEVLIHCVICFQDLTIERFRFLDCGQSQIDAFTTCTYTDCCGEGHSFCTDCVYTLRECAVCRHTITKWEAPRQIYVNFAATEPLVSRPTAIVDGLDIIDTKTPAVSLRRAVKKVRSAAKTADENTSASSSFDKVFSLLTPYQKALLEAVTRLESVLCPLSEDLERERTEKAAVVKKLQDLERRQEELNALQSQLDDLEEDLQDEIENRNVVLASKEVIERQLQSEMEENVRLRKLNEKFHHALKKQKGEVEKLEKELEESNNASHILKKKLKVLTKQTAIYVPREQNPDASLHILEPEEQSRTAEGIDTYKHGTIPQVIKHMYI